MLTVKGKVALTLISSLFVLSQVVLVLKQEESYSDTSTTITSSSITSSSTASNRVNASFALAGFERCGISLLAKNTARIPQVFFASGSNAEQSSKVTDAETQLLKNGNIHEFERNYQGGGSDVSSIRVNAFKSYQLLCSDNGLENFAQYFPETNLVVTVRHPVLHFQSQYNSFYRHVENDGDLPKPKPNLFQGCRSFHFHHWLSRLSLTPSDSREESDLLDQHKLSYHPKKWNGKLFIMQYEQLVDANSTRRNAIEREYENFIGVPSLSFDSTSSSSKMGTRRKVIDICHTKHTAFRYRVIKEAEKAASWIKNYLLESDKVVVPDKYHFLKILDGWSVDPCIQTMDHLTATSRYRVETSANVSRNPEKISMIDERSIRNETDLIDFAIAGFAKCGTTTLMKTTSAVEQVYMGNLVGTPREVNDINNDDMDTFRKRYIDHQRYFSDGGLRLLNGFKTPVILQSQSFLTNLFNHYPSIDLVVSVRHPILHFQSAYNYFYRKVNRTATILPNPVDLIGNCGSYCSHNCIATVENTSSMCTQRSHFHHDLSRLYLTTLQTEKEKELLDHHRLSIHPSWNGRLFLMEIGQLADSDITRKNNWERSYEQFLGIKTGAYNSSILSGKDAREKIINICDDAHKPVREDLLEVGRKASQWIQDYLVHSERVFIENQEHFLSLVEEWKYDPCTRDV